MSERARHTPGPWQVGGGIFGNNVVLCQGSVDTCLGVPVWGELARVTLKYAQDADGREWYSQGTAEANAKLISAVPDYFSGVEQMLAYEQGGGDGWWKGWEMLKAAHAKAKGQP